MVINDHTLHCNKLRIIYHFHLNLLLPNSLPLSLIPTHHSTITTLLKAVLKDIIYLSLILLKIKRECMLLGGVSAKDSVSWISMQWVMLLILRLMETFEEEIKHYIVKMGIGTKITMERN